jgi:S-adenosylmethionine:tRNA ribosyltransferase-isomerase
VVCPSAVPVPVSVMRMRLEDYDYHLPEDLIAQKSCEPRDSSRMMILTRRGGVTADRSFYHLAGLLKKGDCLVVNDSRVIPARLNGRKATGGVVEVLLLSRQENGATEPVWTGMLRPARRIPRGTTIHFGEDARAEVVERISEKKWVLRFEGVENFDEFLEKHGRTPLPPYIRRKDGSEESRDRLMYQTVYARVSGSVAAPTAGLHFSRDLLDRLREQNVVVAPVTLHVGYGTFRPVETEYIEDHVMDEEFFEIGEEAADAINRAQRVIAVGTTSARVLESVADERGRVRPASGRTRLFIRPGHRFRRVDGLITNFHLPRSSLFILVCAFAGRELIRKAYTSAIEKRYRFYSYGDCMFIL